MLQLSNKRVFSVAMTQFLYLMTLHCRDCIVTQCSPLSTQINLRIFLHVLLLVSPHR